MKQNFGKWVVKMKIPILVLSLLLLIPSVIGYANTKVNYDLLTYLPKDIETMKGQEILKDEFGTGAFSMYIVEGMEDKDVVSLKEKFESVDHVKEVLWYDTVMDLSVPKEMLPDRIYDAFNHGDATMMVILFDDTTSSDETIAAVREIRSMSNEQCFLSGMSAILVDTQDLSESEAPIYVAMAVALSALVLSLAMDSYLIPFIFLASIGIAIVYNLGTNVFLGQISYITKALAAVLQLGVTMDYSIFLWHSYEDGLTKYPNKEEAMVNAINETLLSVVGSSITTIAGFIALCFMSFTLGIDLGLVMSKGVLIGVISCVTILPTFILLFDKPLHKTKHKTLIPEFNGIGSFVTKQKNKILIVALILLGPAVYGYMNTPVYYNLAGTLPNTLESVIANQKLDETFNMQATHVLMLSSDVKEKDVQAMADEMKEEDGVKFVLGLNTIKGASIPNEMIPSRLKSSLENENWQLLLIGSEYEVASDEVNAQVDTLNQIAKRYDETCMLIGEAPATKDLITITNHDFNSVSTASIGIIFVIIAFVFRSISLPIILISVIYLGIMINMGIPTFTGNAVPFIASIVIGTIQLGSTVDYAILLTTKYRRNRAEGMDKKNAVEEAVNGSVKSIFVSALSFFAATFGVGLYSNIDVISSLCVLMSRGALISMCSVVFVLPSLLILLDGVIAKTSMKLKVER